ncbi:hypothetical protein AWB78_08045 [Caballeronia calidae]|uniref:Uncharacterized protein n=1 Tax=Caballeronia calidae TaxID=1777139 RepID=A0A158EHN0_9BURK|nr:hypothetical protein [Caballeronia calidae]SAL06392.1 hypothetical protein AWB78_08045 [Caballeronia calidae]
MTTFDFRPRSDAAVVRNLLSEIEAAQDSGASRQDLWRNLCDHHHLKLSFDAFCVALKRARAKKRKKVSAEARVPTPTLSAEKAQRHRESTPEGIEKSTYQHSISARGTEQTSESSPRKNRIRTSRDFVDVHKLDFNEFDDKFK